MILCKTFIAVVLNMFTNKIIYSIRNYEFKTISLYLRFARNKPMNTFLKNKFFI